PLARSPILQRTSKPADRKTQTGTGKLSGRPDGRSEPRSDRGCAQPAGKGRAAVGQLDPGTAIHPEENTQRAQSPESWRSGSLGVPSQDRHGSGSGGSFNRL